MAGRDSFYSGGQQNYPQKEERELGANRNKNLLLQGIGGLPGCDCSQPQSGLSVISFNPVLLITGV